MAMLGEAGYGRRGFDGFDAYEDIADRAGPVSAGVPLQHFEELFSTGSPEEAQQSAEALLEAAARGQDERLKVLGLCKAADAIALRHEISQQLANEAMAKVREAQQLCDDLDDFEEGEAAVNYASARCHLRYSGGDEEMQDKALEDGAEAVALCRLLKSRKGEAASLLTVGDAYHVGKDLDKAVDYHRQALAVFKDMNSQSGVGLAYMKIAEDFLKLKSDVKKAATNAKRAVVVFQQTRNAQEEANSWHLLSKIHSAAGDLAEAVQCVANTRTLCQQLKDHEAETRAMETLVTALLEHDQFQEAVKVCKEIVSLNHAAGDREGEARALVSLAQHLLRNYDFGNAGKVASAADHIFKSIHDKEGIQVTQRLKDAAEHGVKAEHVQQALAQRQEFLNLPQPLIIDPGRKKRMQESFNDFAKSV